MHRAAAFLLGEQDCFPDREAPLGFHGERVQRHDGLLDIEDGSDFVTVSDSRFDADYGGERFHDTGSWFNGRPARLNDVASGLGLGSDAGWDPADVYDYRAHASPAAVERYVLRHAGAGRPYGRP
ncbi:hypothetical protein [Streptomyces sp. NPDC055506]